MTVKRKRKMSIQLPSTVGDMINLLYYFACQCIIMFMFAVAWNFPHYQKKVFLFKLKRALRHIDDLEKGFGEYKPK